mmetsp:Transcript_21359/g.18954  ORF Transcript_21359/g.18954 Transcript_21359/m.18954 type:complete len:165 (+) Transcript_21359:289-783(+)
MVQFQFMLSALKHVRSQKTILGIAKCIKDVRHFLMCKEATLWIIDPYLQKIYQKEGGRSESCVIDGNHIERAVVESGISNKSIRIQPGFKSLTIAKKGIKKNKILLASALSQTSYINQKQFMQNIMKSNFKASEAGSKLFESDKDEPVLAIQCENKELNELNRN